MSDTVHGYRPGPASELPLDEGETVLATYTPDPDRYRRDHLLMGAVSLVAVAVVLVLLGQAHTLWAGALAVVLALGFRYFFFRSEVFARRWQRTEKRLIGPQGRQVFLLELEKVRVLGSDVQLVAKDGAKHLIKHQADPATVVAEIEAARAARARHV